jgi:hypothetical protein
MNKDPHKELNERIEYLDKFTKCSTNNCDTNKSFETLKLKIIQDKKDNLEKVNKLYTNNPEKRLKEIKKIKKEFLKNINKMENIDIYNSCVKENCKAYLIDYLRSYIPFFERQIASYNNYIKDKTLSKDEKRMLKKFFKKDKSNFNKVKNIDNWTNEDFNIILNKLASIENPKFIFL